MGRIIDLDANTTTPLDPRVLAAVVEALERTWGNPSSTNALGEAARDAVDTGRAQVAGLIGAEPADIVFTSGATEAINLAIAGIVRASGRRPAHVITSTVEHKAVLKTILHLRETGDVEATFMRPDSYGLVGVDEVRKALRDDTVLVCLIHGNNEIGTLNPIRELGRLLKSHSAVFFVDAAQSLGYFPPSVSEDGIDAMSLSSHKMYGPKGIGALYFRHGVKLAPIVFGGGQERGYRSGTLNVPGIVGFGAAAEIACQEAQARVTKVSGLAKRMLERLRQAAPDLRFHGHPDRRLPGLLSVTVPYVEYYELKIRVPRLAFSRSSACTEGSGEPSHVLTAIGLSPTEMQCTFRFGLSAMSTDEDVHEASEQLGKAIEQLRKR